MYSHVCWAAHIATQSHPYSTHVSSPVHLVTILPTSKTMRPLATKFLRPLATKILSPQATKILSALTTKI